LKKDCAIELKERNISIVDRERGVKEMAERVMTFEEFRATGKDVADIGEMIEGCDLEGKAGRVYASCLYIEKFNDSWFLILCNEDWVSDDLVGLERRLYEYGVSEQCLTVKI
jgi:hypothetical protein